MQNSYCHSRYRHVYAIVRVGLGVLISESPMEDDVVSVPKVMFSWEDADAECARLNGLRADADVLYYAVTSHLVGADTAGDRRDAE